MKVIDEDKDGIEVLLWKGATVSDLMENKSYTFPSTGSSYIHVCLNDFYEQVIQVREAIIFY